MQFPIDAPGFDGRGLAVSVSLFRNSAVVVDGERLQGTRLGMKRMSHLVSDNAGLEVAIQLAFGRLDPLPQVTVAE